MFYEYGHAISSEQFRRELAAPDIKTICYLITTKPLECVWPAGQPVRVYSGKHSSPLSKIEKQKLDQKPNGQSSQPSTTLTELSKKKYKNGKNSLECWQTDNIERPIENRVYRRN